MSSLTSEELGLLRQESQIWYPDLCDIYRLTPVDDDYGGSQDLQEDLYATNVKCMVEAGSAHEQIIALIGALAIRGEFVITLPAETDVVVTDHLVITTKGNLHLRVQALLSPESFEIDRYVVANRLGEHLV